MLPPVSAAPPPGKATESPAPRLSPEALRQVAPEVLQDITFEPGPRFERGVALMPDEATYLHAGSEGCIEVFLKPWRDDRFRGKYVLRTWSEKGVQFRALRSLEVDEKGVLLMSHGGQETQERTAEGEWRRIGLVTTFDGGPHIEGVLSHVSIDGAYFARLPARTPLFCEAREPLCDRCELEVALSVIGKPAYPSWPTNALERERGLWPERWQKQCGKRLDEETARLVILGEDAVAWRIEPEKRPPALYRTLAACEADADLRSPQRAQ